jgi:hypothetical protein
VRVYIGQTRSWALIARLAALGFGECTNRGEFPPRRRPWFLDNGAFSDWRSGRNFDGAAFLFDLISAVVAGELPDFVVCPDRVATGLDSLAFSLRWRALCEFVLLALRAVGHETRHLRWYFVVQDGMTPADVAPVLADFDGIFVGGSLPWKIATGGQWVTFAHERGLPCHIGRVGTAKRVAWARRIGADSIDSCLPLWSTGNLDCFLRALTPTQASMPW